MNDTIKYLTARLQEKSTQAALVSLAILVFGYTQQQLDTLAPAVAAVMACVAAFTKAEKKDVSN